MKEFRIDELGFRNCRRLRAWWGFVALVVCFALVANAQWRASLPGWRYEFPRDHFPHPDFKTEWWYFTGRLEAEGGQVFGYQLTFFRQGLRPPGSRAETKSRFVGDDLKFAHFALTDVARGEFLFRQKLNRGAFGEAGFAQAGGPAGRLAWIEDWTLELLPSGGFAIQAVEGGTQLQLTLEPAKPWAIHGTDGVSQKADGAGQASHYYSGTRLRSTGTVTRDGKPLPVGGESWFDHEWATNQLGPNQVGWDWFSLQFEDGSELMLYQLRTRDGGSDRNSSASFIDPAGKVRHLTRDQYRLTPLETWVSSDTQGRYPIAWKVEVPDLALQLEVRTPVKRQELVLKPIAYWEGLVEATGIRGGQPLRGHGYLELTGYAGELVGLTPVTRIQQK